MTAQDTRPRVAIACQGGGSHTAFTAGVLGRLFSDDVLSRYRVRNQVMEEPEDILFTEIGDVVTAGSSGDER